MVTNALVIAMAALALAAWAEHRHARRVRRVERLAFGPGGRPASWTRAAPIVRCLGVGLGVWGALVLVRHDPLEVEVEPSPRAARQLLVVLDVSPSMNLKDAGPGPDKMTRARWAGRVFQGVLDRIDMKDTRISMVAFYTKALPVLQDTTDKNIVANMMDGMPLYVAFHPGETDMQAGLAAAFEMCKGWVRGSTTLVVISDGDLKRPPTPPRRPASIADVIVIGVGDPERPTMISGHSSRQDEWTLKQIAASLGGHYHEGNSKHLPSALISGLGMVAPRVSDTVGLREAAMVALGLGASMTGLIGPALLLAGSPRQRVRVSGMGARRAGTLAEGGAA